jgi:sugar phosphate isomerase/epimerase
MGVRFACSIVQYNFANYPFEKALENMVILGYGGIETYAPYPLEVFKKRRTELKTLLDVYGLEPVKLALGGYGIESGVGSLADPDEQRLEEIIEHYKENVLLAEENGFSRMLIFPGLEPCNGSDVDEAFRLAARNLGVVADVAADHGVEILIETHAGALAKDSYTFLKMRELSGSQNVYANVDPSNYLVVGDDVVQALKRLGSLVEGVHIKDVIRTREGHYWAPTGEGEVDFHRFLAALQSIGHDGWVVVEYEAGISGRYDADPERGSRDSYHSITSILEHL